MWLLLLINAILLLTGFPRFLKVLEFQTYGFKAWKVLENKHRSLKVLELNFVYGAISKIVHMRCQRRKEMALMIEGGDGVARKKNFACVLMQDSFLKHTPAEFLTITAHSRNACVPLLQTF